MKINLTSFIVTALSMIGLMTLVILLLWIYFEEIKPRIKSWWKRKNKIRFLCNHEYISEFYWYGDKYDKHELKCKLCGKKKIFKIFKEDDNND